MRILLTIAGRAGSKGLPLKNVRPMLGKPLVLWTVEQAINFQIESEDEVAIAVSSDSIELRSIVKHFCGDDEDVFVYNRAERLCGDNVSKLDVLRDVYTRAIKSTGHGYELVVDMDITNPLRNIHDIAAMIEMCKTAGPETIISVTAARRNPYFNQVEGGHEMARITKSFSDSVITRRQDCPVIWDMNCCLYLYRSDWLQDPSNQHPVSNNSMIYRMPDYTFCETDTPMDFEITEFLMQRYYLK